MKCQILFSGKNKTNIFNLLSSEFAKRVVIVKGSGYRPLASYRPTPPHNPLPYPHSREVVVVVVHYDFLKLHYIRNKMMTHVSSLAMGAFANNSNVTNIFLTVLQKVLSLIGFLGFIPGIF